MSENSTKKQGFLIVLTVLSVYFISNLIGGISYSILFVGFINALAVNCAPAIFPTAMGILTALMNCGAFVSNYVIQGIATAAGKTASMSFPFVVCTVVFIVLGIVLFVKPVKM